jgi:hypothetical protein
MTLFIQILGIGILLIILFWIGKILFTVQRGLIETIRGLNSLDERLAAIEKLLSKD